MRWTIGKRLFLALTLASLVIVGLNALATRWSFQRGFSDYLFQQDANRLTVISGKLAAIYAETNSWASIEGNPRAWNDLFFDEGIRRPAPPPIGDRRPPPGHRPPPPDASGLRDRVALVDSTGLPVFGRVRDDSSMPQFNVVVDGVVVGVLLLVPQRGLTEQADLNFATDQNRSTFYIALVILILAAIIAALLSRQLVRPVGVLAKGTRRLAAGDFDERITVVRDDELGDLAHDFNQLADSLQKNQLSRRQWVSDISHELRTPLAILSGELQAIEDGIRQFDDGTRQSLQAEVARLQKLVADLHELTLSDEGGFRIRKEKVNIVALLKDAFDCNSGRLKDADIGTRITVPDGECIVSGDSDRLDQLIQNLIENSIRYTDKPGQIEVNVVATDDAVKIHFADSPPSVSADQFSRLFDRLYRVDDSRSRQSGGSGLGLSICKGIVRTHSGRISAKPSRLGGVTIEIVLPRLKSSRARM